MQQCPQQAIRRATPRQYLACNLWRTILESQSLASSSTEVSLIQALSLLNQERTHRITIRANYE